RDKIAASKAKGMWMGGTPPLGYEPNGRSLAIVDEHAAIVRDIYRRYLDLGNVRLVAEQLDLEGKTTPLRTSLGGRAFGGCRFTRGQLYSILRNPIYVGKIVHRSEVHAGQHSRIVEDDIWQRVQELLSQHIRGTRNRVTGHTSILAGKIVDENDEPLVAVHACKGKVRYRYYVSRSLQHGAANTKGGIRLPAREIESLVAEQIAGLFDDPISLATSSGVAITPKDLEDIGNRSSAIATELRGRTRLHLSALVRQVRIFHEKVEIDVSMEELVILLGVSASEGISPTSTVTVAARPKRSGRAVRLIQPSGSGVSSAAPDQSLIKLLLKARAWWEVLAQGQVNISTLAQEAGVTPAYVTRVVRLAFLAPAVVDAILNGRQRNDVHGTDLIATDGIPAAWPAQISQLLPRGTMSQSQEAT
ncbi:MAG TPA: recombinase family protein, partial [Sphingomicrobium sp.]|nr:recombinase family protein [Sphingomicrobium sp.]